MPLFFGHSFSFSLAFLDSSPDHEGSKSAEQSLERERFVQAAKEVPMKPFSNENIARAKAPPLPRSNRFVARLITVAEAK